MKQGIFILLGVWLFLSLPTSASNKNKNKAVTSVDSLKAANLNWYNLDPETAKILGASVERTYQELLAGKSPKKKVVVAVIDGGVDIYHQDLEGKIWNNPDEIPENHIDDDQNGYIDDVHGWNFLGNAQGENIEKENFEFIRIINQLKPVFDTVTTPELLSGEMLADYKIYQTCQTRYESEVKMYMDQQEGFKKFNDRLDKTVEILKRSTTSDRPTKEQVKQVLPMNSQEATAKKYLLFLYKKGFTFDMLDEMNEQINKNLLFYLNTELNSRKIIGDNPYDSLDISYGNNDVKGPSADHGSFVAGIIAANRKNGVGIDGIAENVEIMVLRVVPDGDEYDKDIALAIRYAVDNGANIINMSFGKGFSPLKKMVDAAVAYADSKGVLLVHAAGNNADNCDIVEHFPTKNFSSLSHAQNWITVGANGLEKGKKQVGIFSNYGNTTVDIFAPGVDIISIFPENKYDLSSGTSFSCPVVSGVAALIWSYFPELTSFQIKDIILSSAYVVDNKVLLPNLKNTKRKKVPFQTLSVTGGVVNAYEAIKKAALLHQ